MEMSTPTAGSARLTASRRQVLKALGLGAAGALIGACSPAAAPAPTAVPQQAATTAPNAAATNPPAATQAPKEAASIRFHARTGSQGEWYDKEGAAFAERTGIKVTVELTPNDEYIQKLSTLLAGGELGDSMWSAPFYTFYPFAARGVLLDQQPLADAAGFDLTVFFPAAMQMLNWEGKQLGLPQNSHSGYAQMYTNLDVWEEVGAELPKWEWRYENEWLEAVTAATLDEGQDGKIDRFGCIWAHSAQGAYTFIKSWGGDWIDPQDLKTCTINSEMTSEALMFMHDLVYKLKVSPRPEDVVDEMFSNQLTASECTGLWAVATMEKTIEDKFRWQVFPMPAGSAGHGAFLGPTILSINKASKQPDAAFQWHEWLCGKEVGLSQMEAGFNPGARADVWEDPILANDVNRQAAFRLLKEALPPTLPGNANISEFNTVFTQGFQAFLLEKDNPKAKIDELHNAIQAVLDKPAP
jgi:multiple sugar transport system substrate-binding protein